MTQQHTSPLESHLHEQKAENIRFLRDECGMHPELVALQLGITIDDLEMTMRRHGAKRDPHQVTRAGPRTAVG